MYSIINLIHQSLDLLIRLIWREICFFLTVNIGEYISPYVRFNELEFEYTYKKKIYIHIYKYLNKENLPIYNR